MKRRSLLLMTMLLPAMAHAQMSRPVRVGADGPESDACASNGAVVGLRRDGDNFLSVRAAPSAAARQLDTLTMNEGVFVCETSADGRWYGVVWDGSGAVADCGVSSPLPRARPYRGPCASGWVSARFIKIVAG